MTPLPARGLYAITAVHQLDSTRLYHAVEEAIGGGAAVIQYRDKSGDTYRKRKEARELLAICRQRQVPLIINDDVELTAEIGADGIHLGQEDTRLNQARKLLEEKTIIGISCYNRPELALAAQESGADYVAFGRFYPSATKPQAVPASLEMLREVRPHLKIPVVAIGGITPENGAEPLTAGADLLAVIQGVFSDKDPRAAAKRFAGLF